VETSQKRKGNAMDLVIRGGTVVEESGTYMGDIAVRDGKIAAVHSPGGRIVAGATIDAGGKLVLPGVIDSHVHMEIPFCGTVSSDDFTSGSIAAAFGGVTTMIDFAIQTRGETLAEAVEKRRQLAAAKSAIDFGLHCGITDWNEKTRSEMKEMVDAGVPSFKLFMIYKEEGWMADDGMMFECFEEAASLGATVCVHAENPHIIDVFTRRSLEAGRTDAMQQSLSRPNFSESEAVQRAIYLASMSGARVYIVHMSTADAARIVEEWLACGYPAFAETCPQYLMLTSGAFEGPDGHLYATCPPIRYEEDCEYLWKAVADGSIQVVSTDHCSFTRKQKDMWGGDFRKIPFGLPGVETLLPILMTHGVDAGRFPLERLVEVLCSNPARLFGLYPGKGTIRPGSDADLIIIDPGREVKVTPQNLHMNCDYSPYDGEVLKGFPDITIQRGNIIVDGGEFRGAAGQGRFLKRSAHGGDTNG
jgi:dihydropyrimidinase